MKPALQLRVQAQLALTPQLQQAIKLLQLSSIELEAELNLALESNPLLDIDESETEDEAEEFVPAEHTPSAAVESSDSNSSEPVDSTPEFDDVPLDLGGDSHDYRASAGSGDEEDLQAQDVESEDLRDHLLWQLNLTPLSTHDRGIATAIIEAVNDDGYLEETNAVIAQSLADLFVVSAEQVEGVRHRIQRFDPVGVASRTLGECLDVQLEGLDAETPGLAKARQLVGDCLDLLARNDRTRLCLRLYYVEGLKLAQIGRLTHEHEATISRKLDRARRDIRRRVERLLHDQHGLHPAAIAECLACAAEGPEMQVARLLGAEKPR